ncbi:MAG: FtsL-like putative cell division protein [Chitinophagales bacterium]
MAQKRRFGSFLKVFDVVEGQGFRSILMQLPYVLFLVFLGFLHIANNHLAESYVRQIARTERDVKNLRWEYTETANNLMKKSRLEAVAQLVAPYGLKELRQPPTILEVKR